MKLVRILGRWFHPKTDNWENEVEWADIIVFDDVLGMGTWAADVRKKGKLVIGGTPYTDQLEDDRTFGQEDSKNTESPFCLSRNSLLLMNP